ncbi:MAG: DeoR/GlpR transcriptional regulator [Chloroflexales bacterium]|nr:DeoR/GlpR transcriptional regulator [Chloroflexales bacterium]
MANARSLDRLDKITRILLQRSAATIRDLAHECGVSGWTIRRDLAVLEHQRLVRRYHGGVALVTTSASTTPRAPGTALDETALAARRAIGQRAAELIEAGQRVVIGAGTTTHEFARALKGRRHLWLFTNALMIAFELADEPGLRVTCIGGEVHADYSTLTGPLAERVLRTQHFDVAVIGVGGLTIREGLTVESPLNAATLAIMLGQSARVIVVADRLKVGRVGFAQLAPLSSIHTLVTDKQPPDDFSDALRDLGVELIVAL